SITYPSLKLAKLLGVDASCDTAHFTYSAHNSSSDANMRATVLKMTAKLESLGLLNVFRRKRSNDMDKANKLIPVLPDRLYDRMKDLPINLKVSDSSKLDHESNLEHILRTKLFVPIELEFMKSLFKNNLPSKYKLFFLNCIMSAYRNFRQNFCSSDILSFSSTSSELIRQNNISKRTLFNIFKYIKQQGDSFFLNVEHKYTKSDDIDCNRYDKSIFVISINPLVFPISHICQSKGKEISNINQDETQGTNTSIFLDNYKGFREGVQKKQPSSAKKAALNNKEEIIKNKDIDYIDANCENSSISCSSSTLTSEKNYKEEFLEDKQCLSSSEFYNNSSFFNDFFADFTDSQQQNSEVLQFKQPCSNKNLEVSTSVIKDISEYKELRHFYPISSDDSKKLNFCAGREFDTNFTNQLLLKLYIKYPEKRFKNKFTFLDYMVKALKKEKHQAPLVNNTSFRFSCNINEQEKRVLEYERYLSQIENSFDTSKKMCIKKKIAGRFSSEVAYKILTKVEFKLNPDNSFITALIPSSLALSERQTEILSDQLEAVYGINGYYVEIVTASKDLAKAQATSKALPEEMYINTKESREQQEMCYFSAIPSTSAWHGIRQDLIAEFGKDIDNSWFSKAIVTESKETGLLGVIMPNKFMSDFIKNRYGYAISRISGTFGFKYIEYNY
ncbi:DnaA N-terminal domain-containing protein, partial [Rickettsia bellii]